MAFANGKKIKLVAGFVASKLIYLKKSKSYFPQSEIKGKNYGMEMDGYLPPARPSTASSQTRTPSTSRRLPR